MKRRWWFILTSVVLARDAGADNKLEATALFDQGVKDLSAGNVDQACKELAGSLARLDDSGTKGALAVCYTKQGRTASAWLMWRDLADTAPTADLKADAATNAHQLEPRIPHFTLHVGGATAGLVITVNGTPTDPGLGVPLPVDPGPLVVVASAPGYVPWTQTYLAVESKQLAIDVPALVLPQQPVTAPVTRPQPLAVRAIEAPPPEVKQVAPPPQTAPAPDSGPQFAGQIGPGVSTNGIGGRLLLGVDVHPSIAIAAMAKLDVQGTSGFLAFGGGLMLDRLHGDGSFPRLGQVAVGVGYGTGGRPNQTGAVIMTTTVLALSRHVGVAADVDVIVAGDLHAGGALLLTW